jgi:hypothetical protein
MKQGIAKSKMGKSAWIFRHPVWSTLGPAFEYDDSEHGARQPTSIFVNHTNEKVDGWFLVRSSESAQCSHDWRDREKRISSIFRHRRYLSKIGEDSLGGSRGIV